MPPARVINIFGWRRTHDMFLFSFFYFSFHTHTNLAVSTSRPYPNRCPRLWLFQVKIGLPDERFQFLKKLAPFFTSSWSVVRQKFWETARRVLNEFFVIFLIILALPHIRMECFSDLRAVHSLLTNLKRNNRALRCVWVWVFSVSQFHKKKKRDTIPKDAIYKRRMK